MAKPKHYGEVQPCGTWMTHMVQTTPSAGSMTGRRLPFSCLAATGLRLQLTDAHLWECKLCSADHDFGSSCQGWANSPGKKHCNQSIHCILNSSGAARLGLGSHHTETSAHSMGTGQLFLLSAVSRKPENVVLCLSCVCLPVFHTADGSIWTEVQE